MHSKHSVAAPVKSVILFCLLLTGACQTTSVLPPTTNTKIAGTMSTAALERKAANSQDDVAARLYLAAGNAYFHAADIDAAERAVASIEPGWLAPQELSEYQLLVAELALIRNDLTRAERALEEVDARTLATPQALRLRAKVCAGLRDYVCAANLLIEAADGDLGENEQIWQFVGQASWELVLEQAQHTHGTTLGWWDLQLEMLSSSTGDDQRTRLTRWQTRNPNHPASHALPQTLAALQLRESGTRQIALLLPLSGPYSRAGEAVRDGFLAASLHASLNRSPRIRIYDSQSQPLPLLYEQMLTDGAELVIGPLQKPLVTELNDLNPSIPVLALNYLEDEQVGAPDLLQFGLAIEDEARTIANRLLMQGMGRVLVLHNYEDWSVRAQRQLAANLEAPQTVQAFTDIRTITESVGAAMQIAASQSRRDELSNVLGTKLEFLARARGDFDAVVALIGNLEANALVPAMRFHFANHLPVYASSQTIRGTTREKRSELEGFHIAELPGFLAGGALLQEMEAAFSLEANPFAALYALGIDAFSLSTRLDGLLAGGTNRMLGSTGELTLEATGQIRRQLAWAVVRRGVLRADTGSDETGSATGSATGTAAGR